MDVLVYEVAPMLTASLFVYPSTSYSRALISSSFLALSYLILRSLSFYLSFYKTNRIIGLKRYLYSLAISLLSVFPIHCTLVGFGAALFENVTETLVLSLSVSILTVLPCTLSFRLNYRYFVSKLLLFELYSLEELDLVTQVYSVCICLWLSAFPILLDWDRPWQKWPIPCLFGIWAGFCFSKLCSIVIHSLHISRKFTHRSYSLLS